MTSHGRHEPAPLARRAASAAAGRLNGCVSACCVVFVIAAFAVAAVITAADAAASLNARVVGMPLMVTCCCGWERLVSSHGRYRP